MCRKVTLMISTGIKEVEIGQNVNYTRSADSIFKMVGVENFDLYNGKKALEVATTLLLPIEKAKLKQKEIEENAGHGIYIGVITFLQSVYDICLQNPACTVKIS